MPVTACRGRRVILRGIPRPVSKESHCSAGRQAAGGACHEALSGPHLKRDAEDDRAVPCCRLEHGSDDAAGPSQQDDRVAEAVADSNADIVVNIQGDEPLIDPRLIDAAIQPLVDEPAVAMATARRRLQDQRSVEDPNVVKVVCDARGRALYFSRWPIPYVRGQSPNAAFGCYWQHIGLYVYRREFLLEFARMAPTPLEQLEKLEQLRALENGYPIAVVDTEYASVGVDTPEDLKRVEMLLQQKHGENRTNA